MQLKHYIEAAVMFGFNKKINITVLDTVQHGYSLL